MKKIALRLTALVLAVISITMLLSSCSITILEEEFQLQYIENKDSCTLVGYIGDCPVMLVIPDTYNGKPVVRIAGGAFSNCHELLMVTIGSNVTEIGARAFSDCPMLQEVTLGKNLQSIEEKAFYCCVELIRISIPEYVTNIGKEAFMDCVSLKSVPFERQYGWSAVKGGTTSVFSSMDDKAKNAEYLVYKYSEFVWSNYGAGKS
ncbi:MAG: leucine-rich repeat domain-containing protein [Clostridia bacterium]|nr:leucine-rich repeat domain-containing protein [Clostridia bacterium]